MNVDFIKLALHWKVSTNQYYSSSHWSFRSYMKKNFQSAYVPIMKTMKKQTRFPVYLKFKFEFKGRSLDCSNLSIMGKMLEDCLVFAGVMPDDTPEYVKSVTYQSGKGKEDCVCIMIMEDEYETKTK